MNYNQATKTCFNECVKQWKPPEKLLLSEWADKYAYLSAESAHEPGKWKTIPYQKDILDAFVDPKIEKITFMKSARVGYTKILNQVLGFHIHHDPKPVLIVQPTVEDAQGYSKEELAPMLRDTPVLSDKVAEAKSRDSNNTILKKSYPGGFMSLVGANSARGFRRISVPIILFDEVDGYPPTAGQEGDQIKLGSKRAEWFWDKKIGIGSTPTVKGISRVEKSFLESDQRFYYVPCPFCKEKQTIEFRNLKWPPGEPEKAQLECQVCKKLIPHSKKRWMIERGEWRAHETPKGHAGFFIWAGYSYAPNATWGKIAAEFLECKDDPELLKTFKNTTLGQTWEEDGEQPDWKKLKDRAEPYKQMTVPAGGYILTAGVDVQGDRLVVVVRAWGRGEESWLILYDELFGDPEQQEVWGELDNILNYNFPHASGVNLNILSMAVDSGHKAQVVYNYARLRDPKVFAVKGMSNPGKPIIGRPSSQDVTWLGQTIKNGIKLWPIGDDTAKSTIYSRFRYAEPGPRCYHWPESLDDDYFIQITAEKKVLRYVKGFPVYTWHKLSPRNDALDCEKYAYAAALRIGLNRVDWDGLEKQVIKKPQQQPKPIKTDNIQPKPNKTRRRW